MNLTCTAFWMIEASPQVPATSAASILGVKSVLGTNSVSTWMPLVDSNCLAMSARYCCIGSHQVTNRMLVPAAAAGFEAAAWAACVGWGAPPAAGLVSVLAGLASGGADGGAAPPLHAARITPR